MGHFCLKMLLASPKCMGQTYPRLSQTEEFGDFLEGWVPFLFDIQAKSWMDGRYALQLPIISYYALLN